MSHTKGVTRHLLGRPLVAGAVLAVAAALATVPAATPATASVPTYGDATQVSLAGGHPLFSMVDPYANAVSSPDGLKPARPFWYAATDTGLTILRMGDNRVVKEIPYPASFQIALPTGDGPDFMDATAPATGWEPVGMTVSYPTEESLASTSETPATNVFIVMKRSGYEWASETNLPDGRDPGLRDKIVPMTSADTESSLLLQMDVTDPSFSPDVYPTGPVWVGGLLGHDAGQPAFDPATGNVYVPNMPSASLPTSPRNLTSFVSTMMPIAMAEAAAAEPASGAPADPPLVLCGPEHPDEGLLAGEPYVWPCVAEGGEGELVWDFQDLPSWVTAHQDKVTGELDGILYGTPPSNGTWTFTVTLTDLGEDGQPGGGDDLVSDVTPVTLNVTASGVAAEAEAGWEVGAAGGMAFKGTGDCTAAPTDSPGSMVPRWVDAVSMDSGCAVMGTAPVSGEYYEFALPNFHLAYPYDREPVVLSGSVMGTYGFDELPSGVGLSGLAWHQIDKIHDPSTEADILNGEFVGVEPLTGQLYKVLLPQGSIEVNEGSGPPEMSPESDEISPEGAPLLESLLTARPDIANALAAGDKVRFGDVAVEADRQIVVTASEIVDAAGATKVKIGGSSEIADGALLSVKGGTVDAIAIPGVQAKYLGLDSDLRPAVPGSEPGQVDHGALWVTGTTSGKAAVIDTDTNTVDQTVVVPAAGVLGGTSVDFATRTAYVPATDVNSVALFGAGGTLAERAPTIWTGETATFYIGQEASFPVVATGNPTPTLSLDGALPAGVEFIAGTDGTAVLAGTPAEGTGNDYTVTIRATNGIAPDAATDVIITVVSAPTITSADSTTFNVGCAGSFPVTVNGAASLLYVVLEAGPNGEPVPSWLTITTDEATGMSTLDGTPPGGSEGTYVFTIRATTGTPPDDVQTFTLTVDKANECLTPPTVVTNPVDQTVEVGQSATFSAAASGNPLPTVQWQVSSNGGSTWSDIAGATSASYSTDPATTGMNGNRYRAVFSNGTAPDAVSTAALLRVNAPTGTAPSITTQPVSQTVTAGQTATFTAAAVGDPAPTTQWQRQIAGVWTDIADATGTSYTTPATTSSMNGYQYRAVFSNGVGSVASNVATLTVNTAPAVTRQPANQTATAGETATFTAAASGNPVPTVQWQQNTGGASWSNIAGATSTSYTTPVTTLAMSGNQYRAVFTNSVDVATSNAATLTVYTRPAVATQPTNQTVTAGSAATFESTATGVPTPTVQWQELSTAGGAEWTDIAGATGTVYRIPSATTALNGYRYRAVFTNAVGVATSNAATLLVTNQSVQLEVLQQTLPQGTVGQTYSYRLLADGGTTPYTWSLVRRSSLPSGLSLNSAGTISGRPRSAGTYSFTVQVADSAGHTATRTLSVTILRAPRR